MVRSSELRSSSSAATRASSSRVCLFMSRSGICASDTPSAGENRLVQNRQEAQLEIQRNRAEHFGGRGWDRDPGENYYREKLSIGQHAAESKHRRDPIRHDEILLRGDEGAIERRRNMKDAKILLIQVLDDLRGHAQQVGRGHSHLPYQL